MPIYIAKYMYSDLYFEMKGVKAYWSLLDRFVVDLGLEMERNRNHEQLGDGEEQEPWTTMNGEILDRYFFFDPSLVVPI